MTKENKIPFTQTKEYLSWHEAVGEKTFYKEFFHKEKIDTSEEMDFQIDGEKEFESIKKIDAICASFVISLRIGNVLYVPYGPVIFIQNKNLNKEIKNYLYDLAKQENCVFVRLENEESFFDEESFFAKPAKKTFAKEGIFQPRVEWWLKLSDTEDNIYNNFHKDHRYSIRRAQKENIEIEIVKENLGNYFEDFWKLLQETSTRDGFSLYYQNYYKEIFKNSENKFLVFTKDPQKFLSVALIVMNDRVANLVFAGSLSEGRERGFNHFMQWEAIKQAKNDGCEFYNFGGIYENGYGKASLQGVTNFKKRFGGFVKFHGDFLDIPVKKIKYYLYILNKTFRAILS